MDEFNSCVEEKVTKKKYKYDNIQEAITNYDFTVARDFLACHPTRKEIKSGGLLSGKERHYPYLEDLKLIVESEINYFISQGELQKAENTAKEAGVIKMGDSEAYDMPALYKKLALEGIMSKLNDLLGDKQFSAIYDLLSDLRSSVLETKYDLTSGIGSLDEENTDFNDKARQFNATLDKVLAKYKYMGVEKNEIKAVIELAAPELVKFNYGSKLADVYKKEATNKYLK
jgi:hypothetical protein